MTLEHRVGDLFEQRDVDALGHGVNCVGKMGSGIAPLFKSRFPDMHAAYVRACNSGALQVGGVFPWALPNGRFIYNLASQHRTGRDARLDAVRSSLVQAFAHAAQNNVASIAIPRIGAGIGGLRWDDVLAELHAVADDSPVTLVVVSLPNAV